MVPVWLDELAATSTIQCGYASSCGAGCGRPTALAARSLRATALRARTGAEAPGGRHAEGIGRSRRVLPQSSVCAASRGHGVLQDANARGCVATRPCTRAWPGAICCRRGRPVLQAASTGVGWEQGGHTQGCWPWDHGMQWYTSGGWGAPQARAAGRAGADRTSSGAWAPVTAPGGGCGRPCTRCPGVLLAGLGVRVALRAPADRITLSCQTSKAGAAYRTGVCVWFFSWGVGAGDAWRRRGNVHGCVLFKPNAPLACQRGRGAHARRPAWLPTRYRPWLPLRVHARRSCRGLTTGVYLNLPYTCVAGRVGRARVRWAAGWRQLALRRCGCCVRRTRACGSPPTLLTNSLIWMNTSSLREGAGDGGMVGSVSRGRAHVDGPHEGRSAVQRPHAGPGAGAWAAHRSAPTVNQRYASQPVTPRPTSSTMSDTGGVRAQEGCRV